MHWFERFSNPVVYGHRGASKYAPENTAAAFELALSQGADGFELDTMLSQDGVPVVIHDSSVDRTTNGSGKVDLMKLEELHQLDAGSWFSEEFKGERIPSLEAIFARFKDRALVNVELKNHHAPFNDLPVMVVDIAKKVGILDQLIFSSFDPTNLVRIKHLAPRAYVALITAGTFFGIMLNSRLLSFLSPVYIHPHFSECSPTFIDHQHQRNRKVNTWTVNLPEDIQKLLDDGVDGIITDDPGLAVGMRSNRQKPL